MNEYLEFPGLFVSLERNELYTALSKFQGECRRIPHNKKAAYGAYADLDTIWDHIREPLLNNNLTVQQFDCAQEGKSFLYTHIGHSSGQWMMCRKEYMPAQPTNRSVEQAAGSALSYYKRYQLVAFLGLNDGGDNDGEQNMVAQEVRPQKRTEPEFITNDQLQQLEYELREFNAIKTRILTAYGYDSLAAMPKDKFLSILNRIREIKRDEFNV